MIAMKRLTLAFVLAALLAPSLPINARTQTADEVIEKYLAALGGRAALSKITTRKGVGAVTVGTPNGDLPGTIETYSKAPNMSRGLIKLDLSAFGMSETMIIDQRFNGDVGWMLNNLQGDTQITGTQLENMKQNVFPTPLLNYKEQGMQVALLPEETIAGVKYVVLQLTPKAGSSSKMYLDPQTWLVGRMVSQLTSPETGNFEQVSTVSDYRDVDGIKVPFSVVNSSDMQNITIKLTSVEHNVAIDDAIFSVK
jgi:outer membrane lipoprotein-sorting protein